MNLKEDNLHEPFLKYNDEKEKGKNIDESSSKINNINIIKEFSEVLISIYLPNIIKLHNYSKKLLIFFSLIVSINFGINLFSIIWSSHYLYYTCEQNLALWTIVNSSFNCFSLLYSLLHFYLTKNKSPLYILLDAINLISFIIGNYILFNILQIESYICPYELIILNFSIIISIWIYVLLLFLWGILFKLFY